MVLSGSGCSVDTNSSSSCSGRFDSRIIYRGNNNNNDDEDDKNNNNIGKNMFTTDVVEKGRREGRIIGLMRINPPRPLLVFIHASAHMAFHHFNQRSGAVLSYLPNRLKDCDFYFSWEFIDSSAASLRAASEFLEENEKVCRHHSSSTTISMNNENADAGGGVSGDNDISIETCPPFAVLGGLASRVSHILSILGNAYHIPAISALSTAEDLDGKPFFARTIPTDAGIGEAMATYLDGLNVSHVAIMYSKRPWGINFHGKTVLALQQRDITVLSLPFLDDNDTQNAVQQLVASKYRYVICLCRFDDTPGVLQSFYNHGVMGHPGYTWLLTEVALTSFLNPSHKLDRTEHADVAKALHGSAYIEVDIPPNESFERQLSEFSTNKVMQQDFIEHFKHPEGFDGFDFPFMNSVYTYYIYDAVMALGIAACDTPGLFTGEEFYETLLRTQFQGISGPVSFDPVTRTKSASSLLYGIRNIVISEERSTSEDIYLENRLTSLINITNNSIDRVHDYIYADNTTQQPSSLPPLVQEQNLIPRINRIIGLSLGGLVLALSVSWMIWTYKKRNCPLIRACQPVFLCKVCIGTFIMGLTVIPLGFQEPLSKQLLDVGCMSIPWLMLIGFVTSFSAIFAKTWRLNRLIQSGASFQRSQVYVNDVTWPFVSLITTNFVLLIAWTLTDPLQWVRVEFSNYDSFGRSKESVGRCNLSGLKFLIPLLVVDFVPVLVSLYQCWKARNISDELSDSISFSLGVASIAETTLLSIPVLIAAKDNASASYVLRSLFICSLCFAILLPIFIPKILKNRTVPRRTDMLEMVRSARW